jgi:nitrate reductase assembly molybdenum cofactor insertion protein NarJ
MKKEVKMELDLENKIGSFVLASLLSCYPSLELEDQLPILFEDKSVKFPENLKALVLQKAKVNSILDLQSEYIDTFDRGQSANPLNETEYDRRRLLAKGTELSDIAGFYKAFGFDLDPEAETIDNLDHISIELEFYALLLIKQQHLQEKIEQEGVEIVLDARKKFMQDHLGRFSGAILQRPGVQASEFYYPLFVWINQLIADECAKLNLKIDLVNWFDDQKVKEEEMNCGSLGVCNK